MRHQFSIPRIVPLFGVLAISLLGARPAQAQITVFLDFSNFNNRLTDLQTAQGATGLVAAQAQIQNNIQAQMATIYNAFNVNFVQAAPAVGNYERVQFGDTTGTAGLLGLADNGIDWRNLGANDVSHVYSANFGFAVNAGAVTPLGITNLSTALAGTGAHELGHNLGLSHYDTYGDPRITPANYNNTNDIQNTHIMATGQSGISAAQRQQPRTFSQIETAKLEYASGLTNNAPQMQNEQAAAHGTAATAQQLFFKQLPISKLYTDNMIGAIGAGGENDYYKFFAGQGAQFDANTFTQTLTGARTSPLDTQLTLYGTDGTTVLFTNDDIQFNGNQWNAGTLYSNESDILNYIIPAAGTYYLDVNASAGAAVGANTGSYELFVAVSGTPEPGSLALFVGLCASGTAFARRRRRR